MEQVLEVTQREEWRQQLLTCAKDALREDGWTEAQIAAWEADADALAEFFDYK